MGGHRGLLDNLWKDKGMNTVVYRTIDGRHRGLKENLWEDTNVSGTTYRRTKGAILDTLGKDAAIAGKTYGSRQRSPVQLMEGHRGLLGLRDSVYEITQQLPEQFKEGRSCLIIIQVHSA